MSNFTIKQLLENGVHYGHSTRRWNPKMVPYIYGTHNGVHIINLQKTAPMLASALENIKKVVANGGRILFVGTKKQSSAIIKEYAEKCGQYYVNHRWLGGMLTNWKTISLSINNLNKMDKQIEEGMLGLTKKEKLNLIREREKLNLVLGGIRTMGGLPSMVFVLDSMKEFISIEESKKLNIPVIAIADTNADPDKIDFIIPGNDDAIKAIRFYCEMAANAVIEGIQEDMNKRGGDAGANPNLEIEVEEQAEEKVDEENTMTITITEEITEETPVIKKTLKEEAKEVEATPKKSKKDLSAEDSKETNKEVK